MTLGNFTNIPNTTETEIVSGNINNKLVILNIDNSSLSPTSEYQILYSLPDQTSPHNQQFSAYHLDEEEEEEDEEFEDDPDFSPESDEGYRTNCSVTSGSPSSSLESAGRLVTGTLGEATEDEHGNLMWLVDFKLDFLSDIDKEVDRHDSDQPEKKKMRPSLETVVVDTTETLSLMKSPPGLHHPATAPAFHSVKPGIFSRQISSAKPNYTYTDLITLALRDKTQLTVSEIYQWIRSVMMSSPNKN